MGKFNTAHSPAFLTAFGQHDSHAKTIAATGQPNGSPRAGQPYSAITWPEIIARAAAPSCVDKSNAQFFIPSDYRGFDGRTHAVQIEHGRAHCLTIDIDKGNPTFEALNAALRVVLGDVETLIYSSSGAKPEAYKWRALIPLARPIAGADFQDTQTALNALLLAQGIICDPALKTFSQPVFLPNIPKEKRDANGKPLFYRHEHSQGERLDLTASHAITRQREATRAKRIAEEHQRAEKAAIARAKRLEYVKATGDDFEPIQHFKDNHTVAEMLARYGFVKHPRKPDYTSPLSESGSYGTRDFGDYWVAVSSWAVNHGVGRETSAGKGTGDAFDLYAYFEHGNDKRAAVRAYAKEVRPEPPEPPKEGATDRTQGPSKYTAPSGGVQQARRVINTTFKAWRAEVTDWIGQDPKTQIAPARAAIVSTGIGKSYAGREHAIKAANETNAQGCNAPIVIAVPRHKLGGEFLEGLEGKGHSVEIYRGKGQLDPLAEGETMCRRNDEANAVQRAGGDVSTTLCKQGEFFCPFYDICGTQRQAKTRAKIWIVPHANLFRAPPSCIGRPAALIVDEDPTNGIFQGFDGHPSRISLHDLATPIGGLSIYGNADFIAFASDLEKAAQASKDRRLEAAHIAASTEDLSTLRSDIFKTMIPPDCGPTTPPQELKAELARVAATNARALKLARLVDLIRTAKDNSADVIAGLSVQDVTTPEGDTFQAIRLQWIDSIGAGWNAPTICTSATLQETLLRHLWPQLGQIAKAEAAMPHVKTRQITDRAFGLSSIVSGENAGASTATYAQNIRRKLRRYIEARAAGFEGQVLVIAQKAALEALGPMPENVQALHFNALSGLDGFKDVRAIIQIGRTAPSPSDVEARAELMLGRGIDRLAAWYDKAPASLLMADGSTGPQVFTRGGKGQNVNLGHDHHPNATAEAIRWSICEGELIQGIGRGRGVNRTPETPLQIDILTNVPLPIPVNEARTFESYEPTPEQTMQARGVIMHDTTAKGAWHIIAATLPDLFPSADAARKAFNRPAECSRGHNPISIPIRICPREGFEPAKIKPKGARYAVDVQILSDPDARALLCEKYGFEIVASAPPALEPEAAPIHCADRPPAPEPPELTPRERIELWMDFNTATPWGETCQIGSKPPLRIETNLEPPPLARAGP